VNRLRWVVIAGLLAGLALSPKLWLSDRSYPQTPIWSGLPGIPPPFDRVVYIALLLSLLASAVKPKATWVFLGLAAVLVAFDQSRLQPWFYQYCFMLLALSSPAVGGNVCRLIICSIYFWSGMQKLNGGFAADAFPWLVEPLKVVPVWLGLAVPFLEAGLGIALLYKRTRRPAALFAICMHAAILLAIGPFGHNHNTVVWPWNIAMAASVFLLFWNDDFVWPKHGWLPRAVLVLFAIAPALSFAGLWDHYPSWALYSGNRNEGDFYFSDAVYDKLPDAVQDYVTDEGPNRAGLNIGEWSFGELNVPAYPEVRIYRQVLRSLCRYGDVTLEVQGKATLFGGRRKSTFTCAAK
jgi:uncharacterized membrane protein YphA (DoxX/SURF4 family)